MPAAKKSASKRKAPATKPTKKAASASSPKDVDAHIKEIGGWRGKTLTRIRGLVQAADPDVIEQVQWRKASNNMLGVATWAHDGLLFTGESYKDKVKMTFARGAALADPKGLFNGKDNGATRRSIDLYEGDDIDAMAFTALVRAAIALNVG